MIYKASTYLKLFQKHAYPPLGFPYKYQHSSFAIRVSNVAQENRFLQL